MNSIFSNVDEIWAVHPIYGGIFSNVDETWAAHLIDGCEVELYSGRKISITFDSKGSTIEEEGMMWKDHVYYTPDQIESLKTAIIELRDEVQQGFCLIAKCLYGSYSWLH